MDYSFFAFVNRMKYIQRWGLMRNATSDNLQEHSLQTAMIAHMLVIIDNKLFDGKLVPEKAAVYAMYHDAAETITGDMPTPVKYFDDNMRETYGKIEDKANEKLLSMLPDEFGDEFAKILKFETEDSEYRPIVKAADKITAYLKCVEEEKFGNSEFARAKEGTLKAIRTMQIPCVDYFMENFAESFSKPLDEIS